VNFFAILRFAHSKSEFLPKSLETDQVNLQSPTYEIEFMLSRIYAVMH